MTRELRIPPVMHALACILLMIVHCIGYWNRSSEMPASNLIVIPFLSIAAVSGALCFADLPAAAASAVRSLTANSLAFSVLVIAYRGALGLDRTTPKEGER